MQENLTISLLQSNIIWENPQENILRVETAAHSLSGKSQLLILPEMFATGFSMNPEKFAQNNCGSIISALQQISLKYDIALAGSFAAEENNRYFNRGFFISKHQSWFYDKKHLFRMGDEPLHFSAGDSHLCLNFMGWNIALFICYDLRFPLWCRNVGNYYDLAIFVANWPKARRNAWTTLLQARAIENLSYVAGCNRCGYDGNNLLYSGDSMIIDMKGNVLISAENETECIITQTLSKTELENFRKKFPAWYDADSFRLTQ